VTPRRGDYGFDAPYVPLLFCAGAVACSVLALVRGPHTSWLVAALIFAAQAASYVYTTRRGKLVAWDQLLAAHGLRGDERLLDVGCGRGAVLLLAAQRLPRGRATGVDLWSTTDQTGNAEATTRRNAKLEGVSERVELATGDMRALPFPDGSFDVVVSNVAIHNVATASERERAVA
jgi:arsenite methyltransferase